MQLFEHYICTLERKNQDALQGPKGGPQDLQSGSQNSVNFETLKKEIQFKKKTYLFRDQMQHFSKKSKSGCTILFA